MEEKQEYAIRVKNLSKSYRVIHSPWQRLQYYVFHRQYGEDFYALRDVSFEIKKGETFGIIGVNGSGKSTLLQILAGIVPKSSGEVEVSGKISALLELGSGFNPENTGFENIYLNAAILGVRKEDIDKKCKDIIAFADIGDFINEPVKTYSSGMFIRLAFAVAINVDAEVIIIDEALAVGDIFFRQKCYAKLNELKAEGKTIILVSHGMNEVEQFCDRALLLSHGEQVALGKSGDVVEKYYLLNQGAAAQELENETSKAEKTESPSGSEAKIAKEPTFFDNQWRPQDDRYLDLSQSLEQGNGMAHFIKIGLFDRNGRSKWVFRQGEYAYFYSEVMVDKPIAVPLMGIVIVNQKNIIVHGKATFQSNIAHPSSVRPGSLIRSCIRVGLNLEEGEYSFELSCATLPKQIFEQRAQIPHEELNEHVVILANRRKAGMFAISGKRPGGPAQLNFYGLVDLPVDFGQSVEGGDSNEN